VTLAAGLAVALAVAAATPSPAARSHASAPRVETMVVGRHGVPLSAARSVLAAAGTVRVDGRRCTVAQGTPMAVLLALRRAGGPAFALRDYGHCDSAPADSAELFVTTLGGQANSGRSGWEYKVDGFAGSTGAADPSGPKGDGRRLRSGARVLWFYCETTPRGCQRTLAISPETLSVAPGSQVLVKVGGYDDEGALAPVAGASVAMGSRTASSAADGGAALVAPTVPGRYELTATMPGLVPSFPAEVLVR
jgi:hypothetical protein